jgi:hypothetical protein
MQAVWAGCVASVLLKHVLWYRFRLVFALCFPVKPGKCSFRSASAAITYSAGWKEVKQVKAGELKNVSERCLTCKILKQKTGAQAASRSCFARIRGQAEMKKTLLHSFFCCVVSFAAFATWSYQNHLTCSLNF